MITRLRNLLFGTLSGVATQYYDGTGNFSVPAGGASDWDTITTKGSDQDVTNDATLTDDTALQKTGILAGEVWLFELLIKYSASDATRDYKFSLACSAGLMDGWLNSIVLGPTDGFQSSGQTAVGQSVLTATSCGGLAAHGVRPLLITAMLEFDTNCTLKYQFAQNSAGPATQARTKSGSILRSKKVA